MNRRCNLVAATVLLSLACCSHPQAPASPAPESELHPYVRECQLHDSPALLLGAETVGETRFSRQEAGLDPVFLIPCRVLVSHKMEVPPGAFVLLVVPAGRAGTEAMEAENSRFWLVAGEGMESPVRLSKDRSVYVINGLDFYAWPASILSQASHHLRGIWKTMADRIERPGQGRPEEPPATPF